MSFSASESACLLASLLANTAVFALLQAVAIRLVRPRRLLQFSLAIFVASTLLLLCVQYLFVGSRFSSTESYAYFGVLVLCGSAGLCGLYTFLGPATADRSATVHMLRFLLENGSSCEDDELTKSFNAIAFVQKRFSECSEAKILRRDGRRVTLTSKGVLLAKLFGWLLTSARIGSLPGYSFMFGKCDLSGSK